MVWLGSRLPELAQKGSGKTMSDAVVRARWDGTALADAHDIFVDNNVIDDSISQTSTVRLAFAPQHKRFQERRSPCGTCAGVGS